MREFEFFEGHRRCPKTAEDVETQPTISREKSERPENSPDKNRQCYKSMVFFFLQKTLQTLTVVSPETAIIKKLVNSTANTKSYRQLTPNTKHHLDPPHCINYLITIISQLKKLQL